MFHYILQKCQICLFGFVFFNVSMIIFFISSFKTFSIIYNLKCKVPASIFNVITICAIRKYWKVLSQTKKEMTEHHKVYMLFLTFQHIQHIITEVYLIY